MEISVFVLHSVFEEGITEYLLLKALRSYIEVDIYAGLEVHTEKTIASGREKLSHFFGHINVSPLPAISHMLISHTCSWYRHTSWQRNLMT